MNFSEAMFCENYLTSDSHTNTVISEVLAYPSKWRRNRDKAYCTIKRNPSCGGRGYGYLLELNIYSFLFLFILFIYFNLTAQI